MSMTSAGAMGRIARVFMALRIILWKPRRASTSESGSEAPGAVWSGKEEGQEEEEQEVERVARHSGIELCKDGL